MKNDFRSYMVFTVELALKAGKVIRGCADKIQSIEFKGQVDMVTDVDKKAQDIIIKSIHEKFPRHSITAEEQVNKQEVSDFRWIIDPLDGTTNFVHGYPFYCVSIALEHRGEIISAAVYNPCAGEIFTAFKGGGAFCNQKPVSVSRKTFLKESLIATGFSYAMRESGHYLCSYLDIFQNILKGSQGVRRDGSAALDLCFVACGRLDAFFEEGLKEWDVAAGRLILKEAGGRITDFCGKELAGSYAMLVASNGLVHSEIQKITEKFNNKI